MKENLKSNINKSFQEQH